MAANWEQVWEALPEDIVCQLRAAGFTQSTRERCGMMFDDDDAADLDVFVAALLEGATESQGLDAELIRDCLIEMQRLGQGYSIGLKRRRLLRDPIETAGAYLLGDALRLAKENAVRLQVLQVGGMSERKVADWSTRRGRLLAQAESAVDPSAARAAGEESERKRWAESFGRFLMEIGAPVADGASLERMSLAAASGDRVLSERGYEWRAALQPT